MSSASIIARDKSTLAWIDFLCNFRLALGRRDESRGGPSDGVAETEERKPSTGAPATASSSMVAIVAMEAVPLSASPVPPDVIELHRVGKGSSPRSAAAHGSLNFCSVFLPLNLVKVSSSSSSTLLPTFAKVSCLVSSHHMLINSNKAFWPCNAETTLQNFLQVSSISLRWPSSLLQTMNGHSQPGGNPATMPIKFRSIVPLPSSAPPVMPTTRMYCNCFVKCGW
mmetsp:Transcript_19335/g.55437  ORF Transcript_19335/g.55437 Transcript_19335/m.55437 type:complete len:225 (-) Transcript_19335:329-1003(-)